MNFGWICNFVFAYKKWFNVYSICGYVYPLKNAYQRLLVIHDFPFFFNTTKKRQKFEWGPLAFPSRENYAKNSNQLMRKFWYQTNDFCYVFRDVKVKTSRPLFISLFHLKNLKHLLSFYMLLSVIQSNFVTIFVTIVVRSKYWCTKFF